MAARLTRPTRSPRRSPSNGPVAAALALVLAAVIVLSGCSGDGLSTGDPADGPATASPDPGDLAATDRDAGSNDDAGGELPEQPGPGHVGSISSAEGAALRDSDRRAVIIDVRPLEEYLGGHVVGAQHIELGDEELWDSRTNALDPTRPVVVYCNTGALAAEAAERLVDQGFAEVYDLGGMSDWAEGDLPLDR